MHALGSVAAATSGSGRGRRNDIDPMCGRTKRALSVTGRSRPVTPTGDADGPRAELRSRNDGCSVIYNRAVGGKGTAFGRPQALLSFGRTPIRSGRRGW